VKKISERLSTTIWNIEVSASGKLLGVELRDEKNKQVLFSIYHLEKKQWLWENVTFEESWWINLLSINNEHIYLNYFTDEENPQKKKIIVVDIDRLEVIDELYEFNEAEKNKLLELPFHYVEDSVNFDNVADYIKQHCGDKIVKAVDYLQTPSSIAISYYLYNKEKLANFLLIVDQEGMELSKEVIGDGLEKVGMHTFFLVKNDLITIKDKVELKIYML